MSADMTGREKWARLAAGEDVGPMVSPLCDDWCLDQPYAWPLDEPEPFPPGHPLHAVSQQIAMAAVCGWTPSFLAGPSHQPLDESIRPEGQSTPLPGGGSRTETRIRTPLGDLTQVVETKTSQHVAKPMLETEEDYRKKAWLLRQQIEVDRDGAIAHGRTIRDAIGERGVLGTWSGPPLGALDYDNLFYHLADWPEACDEVEAAQLELTLAHLPLLREAGFDYLFYCVPGTEWLSPDIFRERVLEPTRTIFQAWRDLGGWILWHSCGRIQAFVEEGFYNDLQPEIFETMSEPPVGSLPDLAWGRERLDRRIATKGNLSLDTLLNGTPEEVRAGVSRIKEATAGYRHVVGLSDDMLHNTPLENARAFLEEALKRST